MIGRKGGHCGPPLHSHALSLFLAGVDRSMLNSEDVDTTRKAPGVCSVSFERIKRQGPHSIRWQLSIDPLPDVALIRRAIHSAFRILSRQYFIRIRRTEDDRRKIARGESAAAAHPCASSVRRPEDVLVCADDYQLRITRVLRNRFHGNVGRSSINMLPGRAAVGRHE